jgi:hypothetical protein
MISYAMGLPMIHDTRSDGEGGWSYSDSWNDVLQPLGIPCAPGNFTYKWSWKRTKAYCRKLQCRNVFTVFVAFTTILVLYFQQIRKALQKTSYKDLVGI